jgi:hypothetical protein
LTLLAAQIGHAGFPEALRQFLHSQTHPDVEPTASGDARAAVATAYDSYDGPVRVYNSATVSYPASSDRCGRGGLRREIIRANPQFITGPRFDTVLVKAAMPLASGPSSSEHGIHSLLVARILLFFDCFDPNQNSHLPCALVRWFDHPNGVPSRDEDTGMWIVSPAMNPGAAGGYPVQVIPLTAIVRGIHLLPMYGEGFLPEDFPFTAALDAFESYLINPFIDYHAHKLLM